MKQTTILVVEDDESMRDTIEAILGKKYRIIKAVDGREALKELKGEEFQIALIDIRLPDIRGTEILKAIKRERPDVECIIMSAVNDAETAAECFKSGALDYFTKEFDYDIFQQRIKNAESLYSKKRQIRHLQRKIQAIEAEALKLKAEGIDRGDYPLIAEDIRRKRESVKFSDNGDNILTEREMEILKLKSRGLRNKEIANKLSISPETVRNHTNHILHKLNLKSMLQVIAFAYGRGILRASKEGV